MAPFCRGARRRSHRGIGQLCHRGKTVTNGFYKCAVASAVGIALGVAGATAASANSSTKRPNIIVFMADDLGQDAVSLYNEFTADADYPLNAPMPALESLAAQGVTFKNAWAMPVCSTTRAARSTGLYASTTGAGQVMGAFTPRFGAPGSRFDGVEFPPSILNPDDPHLLQKLLQKKGYRTYKFGKWHEVEVDTDGVELELEGDGSFNALDLSDVNAGRLAAQGLDDTRRAGFDEFYGLLSGRFGGINLNGYGGGELEGTGGTASDSILLIDSRKGGDDPRNPTNEFADSAMVSRAIQLIKEAEADGKPYFIEYSALAPHFEYEIAPGPWDTTPPSDYAGEPGGWRTLDKEIHKDLIVQIIDAYNDLDALGIDIEDVRANLDAYSDLYPDIGTRPEFPGPNSIPQRRAAFKSLLAHMDLQLGRLLEHVDLNETFVIFVGDNGTQGGGRFGVVEDPNDNNRSKATVYNNGVLVPFVFAGPSHPYAYKKGDPRGTMIDDLVDATDIYATALQIGGVRQPRETRYSSFSFSRSLNGIKTWRRVNVAELFNATATVGGLGVGVTPFGGVGRAIGDGRFRLITHAVFNDDNTFVCRADSVQDPLLDCLNEETGIYEKEYELEFYDLASDPFENDALLRSEMNREQRRAFYRLCYKLNWIGKRAVYYHNGKICEFDGSNLIDPNPS